MRAWRRGLAAAVLVLLALAGGGDGAALLQDEDFVDERVASGFELATDLCVLPSESGVRFIVLELAGVVRLVENGLTQAEAVVDLRDQVHNWSDKGLMGCAVDVDFDKGKRFIYLAFSYGGEEGEDVNRDSNGRVVQIEMNNAGTKALVETERVLLGSAPVGNGCDGVDTHDDDVICCHFTHCMGGLTMTDSGLLVVSVGDGMSSTDLSGGPLVAQDPYALNGKLLRINRDGEGVAANPFFGLAGSASDNVAKVLGLGLRQPWRLSWDEALSKVWVSEVSWTDWEEVNLSDDSGLNFGWPCLMADEVVAAYAGFAECQYAQSTPRVPAHGSHAAPVVAFPKEASQAISGAVRVAPAGWPSQYRNVMFTADYSLSTMRYFEVDASGARTGDASAVPALFAEGLEGPVKVLEGPGGDAVWYLSLLTQEVRQIRYAPDPSPPSVVVANPPAGAVQIERTTDVEVVLSKRMDGPSVEAAFSLMDAATLADVPVSFSYDESTKRARFRPGARLEAYRTYRCRLGTGAADRHGRRLVSALEWEFTTGSGFTTYASDLAFEVAVNAFGPPERDMSNGDKAAGDGETIAIRGVAYEKGIGVVPFSEVEVRVPEGCTRFQATIGVDDSATHRDKSWVHFEVRADGQTVYHSADEHPDALTRNSVPVAVDVDVTGAVTVLLLVHRTVNLKASHLRSSWGDAQFRCGEFDGEAPEVVSSSPAAGDVEVGTSSPEIVVTFSERMELSSLAAAVRLREGDREVGFTSSTNADATQVALDVGQLAPATVYTLSVSRVAADLAGNALKGAFEASFTTAGEESTLLLVDMEPTAVSSSPAGSWEVSRSAVSIAGASFSDGFVTAPWVQAAFDVPLSCREFRAEVGVPDGAGPDATVNLLVKPDVGAKCTSEVLVAGGAHVSIVCPVAQAEQVKLAVQKGGDNLRDDAMVIAEPRLEGCVPWRREPRCAMDPLREGFKVGNWIYFRGKGYDYRGARLPHSSLRWSVKQHHCPGGGACHFHSVLTLDGVNKGQFRVEDHADYYYFEVVCTVCDGDVCASSSASSYPQTAEITVDSSPTGLVGGVDTLNGQLPLTQRVVVNSRVPLTQRVVVNSRVPLSVIGSQGVHEFVRWRHNDSTDPNIVYHVKGRGAKRFVAEFL